MSQIDNLYQQFQTLRSQISNSKKKSKKRKSVQNDDENESKHFQNEQKIKQNQNLQTHVITPTKKSSRRIQQIQQLYKQSNQKIQSNSQLILEYYQHYQYSIKKVLQLKQRTEKKKKLYSSSKKNKCKQYQEQNSMNEQKQRNNSQKITQYHKEEITSDFNVKIQQQNVSNKLNSISRKLNFGYNQLGQYCEQAEKGQPQGILIFQNQLKNVNQISQRKNSLQTKKTQTLNSQNAHNQNARSQYIYFFNEVIGQFNSNTNKIIEKVQNLEQKINHLNIIVNQFKQSSTSIREEE